MVVNLAKAEEGEVVFADSDADVRCIASLPCGLESVAFDDSS